MKEVGIAKIRLERTLIISATLSLHLFRSRRGRYLKEVKIGVELNKISRLRFY